MLFRGTTIGVSCGIVVSATITILFFNFLLAAKAEPVKLELASELIGCWRHDKVVIEEHYNTEIYSILCFASGAKGNGVEIEYEGSGKVFGREYIFEWSLDASSHNILMNGRNCAIQPRYVRTTLVSIELQGCGIKGPYRMCGGSFEDSENCR